MQGFSRAKAKAGVMPRTSYGVLNHQPFGKRSAVVRTFGTDSEKLIASSRQQYGFLTDVPS